MGRRPSRLHIECSAMSTKILGPSFDLHLGGEDLIFPHHEDEIAQSEGATGKPFVKHWLHGAHLLVEGKKMSKSLGNFFHAARFAGERFHRPRKSVICCSPRITARRSTSRSKVCRARARHWRGLTNALASCAKPPERRPPARHGPLEFKLQLVRKPR